MQGPQLAAAGLGRSCLLAFSMSCAALCTDSLARRRMAISAMFCVCVEWGRGGGTGGVEEVQAEGQARG